jgi:hypothetical protein
MSDELINQEVAQQANFPQEESIEQPTEQSTEQSKTEQSKTEQSKIESERKYKDTTEQNFRVMRERAEIAERRAQEMEQYIRAQQQPKEQAPQEEYDDFDIKDEDFVEGKHVKKPIRKLQKELKQQKQELDEYKKQISAESARLRLRSEMPDFEKVVNQTTLDKLSKTKPALYRTLMATQDLYDCGYSAYEMIKNNKLDINEYEDQDNRLDTNKAKPRSSSAASPHAQEAPLSRAQDYDRRILTEERKEQLRRQVEDAKRNI